VIDLQTGKRVTTLPGAAVLSLTFSANGQRLMALDGEKGALHSWGWEAAGGGVKLKKLAYVPGAGEASLHLESHD
jgi:methylamine dehydrogenase heavy chain